MWLRIIVRRRKMNDWLTDTLLAEIFIVVAFIVGIIVGVSL